MMLLLSWFIITLMLKHSTRTVVRRYRKNIQFMEENVELIFPNFSSCSISALASFFVKLIDISFHINA